MNANQPNSRDFRLDFAKGILILLVIVGHAFFPLYTTDRAYLDIFLYKFIYSFHMPAFMLLSGYFFYTSNCKPFNKVIVSKLISIGVPFLCFSCAIWLMMQMKNFISSDWTSFVGTNNIVYDLCDFLLTSKVMWFLASLLINCFIVAILSRISYGYIGYVLILIGSLFIPVDHSYIHPGYLFLFPFFLIGYYLKKNNVSLFWGVGKKYIIILLCCVSILGLYLYNEDTYIYFTGMNVLTDHPLRSMVNNIHRFMVGVSMCFLFFSTIGYLYSSKYSTSGVVTLIENVGNYTLGIYGFQQVIFGIIINCFELFKIEVPASYVMVFASSFFVMCLSYFLAKICIHFNVLAILFMGRRIHTSSAR